MSEFDVQLGRCDERTHVLKYLNAMMERHKSEPWKKWDTAAVVTILEVLVLGIWTDCHRRPPWR